MPPFWRSITLVSLRPHPSLLLLMPCLRRALNPTSQLLLLLPSADLFQPFLTFPVLVVNSCGVFAVLFPRVLHGIGFYRRFWVLLFCRFLVPRKMCIRTHICVFVRIYLSLRRMRTRTHRCVFVRIYFAECVLVCIDAYLYASTSVCSPTLFGNPLGFAWCFFLDAQMGGVRSVHGLRIE
jgi:hypothetical protein